MPRATITYQNPVYDGYPADPFVWRHGEEYFAVGTGELEAGAGEAHPPNGGRERGSAQRATVFPLLRSPDLVHWRMSGAALIRPPGTEGHHFWAPEVAYDEASRTFYLYYSAGPGDEDHLLRVARGDRPEGPYRMVDAPPLVDPARCRFAIDPHPFRDDDGRLYLFYARNFLDTENGNRAGTALVVDRMLDMTRLAGEERTVLRPRHDWQVYLRDRPMYGKVYDWHTLEGPCVRKRHGRYYCLYSGSNWQTENYGVDWCVADAVTGPYGGESATGPRILRAVPGRVRGPGHNSVVVGPDGATEFIAYHAWDEPLTSRKLCIDRLEWTPDGPRCNGPTWTPQIIELG